MERAKKTRAVYQLQASLREMEPPIWRRVQVWEDTKLPRLHRVLQLVLNSEDYPLHEFQAGRRVYGVPDPDNGINGRALIDERLVPLSRIADREGDTFKCGYDFGELAP